MMHRRGASTIQSILACVLSLGLLVLAYFAGTATCEGPLEPGAVSDSDGGRRRDRDAYGFVAVDLANPLDSKRLLNPPSDVIDRDALAIEQRTQADLMTSRSTLEAVLSNPSLTLRKTKWFSTFKHPIQARRWLERHFHAVPVRGSKLIEVWIDPMDSSHEARTIVMDIVNTYLDDQRKIHQARTLDRQSSLNTLKIKYDNRIRELADRRNNLMLRLGMTNVGGASQSTATDLELSHAMAQRVALTVAVAQAKAKLELVQADAKDDQNRADVRAAEMEMKIASAALDAVQRRIESLQTVLGDISIAMSDLISTQEDLVRTRAAVNEVRDELDAMQSINLRMPVDWARYPTARDEVD